MIKSEVTIDETVELLNDLIKKDGVAISKLVLTRISCNLALADHPTVQCGEREKHGEYDVGFLGVINGLFGTKEGGKKNGFGAIAAVFEDGDLIKFKKTNFT